MELRERLQEKRDWLASTPGMKGANLRLTVAELDRLISGLHEIEYPLLPKIEPRMLGAQEPRGTRRTPQEVAQRLAELYGQNEMHQSPRKRLHNCE